jgi:hypothetical protein
MAARKSCKRLSLSCVIFSRARTSRRTRSDTSPHKPFSHATLDQRHPPAATQKLHTARQINQKPSQGPQHNTHQRPARKHARVRKPTTRHPAELAQEQKRKSARAMDSSMTSEAGNFCHPQSIKRPPGRSSQGGHLGRQTVAGTAHGFYHLARWTERFAQALDMNIDCTLLNEHVVTPHLVQQLRSAVHALGMFHQVMKQLELGGAEFQRLSPLNDTR